MTASRAHLGDSHNFGRRVAREGRRIHKPRTLFWEELVLSARSPLRRALADAAEADGLGRDAFDFLLDLAFDASDARFGGVVDAAALEPLGALDEGERLELATIAGRSLALLSWLGVADLHWENLVLGRGEGGRLVFSPLDVEMILDDLALPTETKLLPDADREYAAVCRHACGVRRLLPYLGKPVDGATLVVMAGAYHEALALFEGCSETIAETLAALPGLCEAPIRVCLRGTDEYVRARSEAPWPPLLDAEEEQLARGDIPYFFRLYERPGIHYYGDESLRVVKTLPSKGDVPRLAPLLRVSKGLRSKGRASLRAQGLFTVLGAFDHKAIAGVFASEQLSVRFDRRALVVTLDGGEELETRRDLRAFVESVYLPCSCGEVRSVFVPETTVCERGAAPSP